MQRQRGDLVPIGEVIGGLGGPVQAIREASPQGHHNQLGFAYQIAFVRVLGRFPQQAPLEIDGEILRFAALQLGAAAETIHAYARRQQTVSKHQQAHRSVPAFGCF